MANNFLPLALIGAGAYIVVKAAGISQAVKNLSVTKGKVTNVKLGFLTIDLTVQLDVNNPTSSNIPFEHFTGSVIHQNSKLASFVYRGQANNIQLKARSITPVVFTVTLSAIALINKIISIVKSLAMGVRNVDSVFTVNGFIYAGGVDVPVKFTHDIRPGAINGIGKLRADQIIPVLKLRKLFFRKKRKKTALPNMQPRRFPFQKMRRPITAPGITNESYSGVPSNELRGFDSISDQW